MSSFKDKSFGARFAAGGMGDAAEGVFEQTYPQNWERWGLDRATINLRNVPAFVRFSPDYLTAKGFVEVQGFGRDQRFKLKDEKLAALQRWHDIFRTDIFVWDSANQRWAWVRLPELVVALADFGEADAFDGGRNPYHWLSSGDLPVVDGWTPFTPTPKATV